ncbi:hypothetical protein [Urbifossiella limnaea]|uniref:Uncharacterized protein n=1 Tax=Urbifossiella limnaea TaxID=2528023 RepID=A0A517XQ08_9BACT|nr:hypothetical protein [Urbifossiella limnaea]QDU19566.1 hypothetical protein ETAA1_14960 [Urbifossiella limnaea]
MTRRAALAWSAVAWVGVWAFWPALTHDHQPTFTLARIVTTALVAVYAAAAFLNHLVLVPRLWAGSCAKHGLAPVGMVCGLTAAALTVIRVSYLNLHGPDADPNGAAKHFAIDLFGMAIHLLAAAGVVALWRARGEFPMSGSGGADG